MSAVVIVYTAVHMCGVCSGDSVRGPMRTVAQQLQQQRSMVVAVFTAAAKL
jgi:hypothetical protein